MSSNQEQEMWFWKVEPVSPTVLDGEDEWLSFDDDDDISAGDTSVKEEVENEEPNHPTRAEVATKLLEELDEYIKEGNYLFFFNIIRLFGISKRKLMY